MSTNDRPDVESSAPQQMRPIGYSVLVLAGTIVVGVTVLATWLTVTIASRSVPPVKPGEPTPASPTVQIDAVRTGLGAGATVGGAMALMLAFRRQRHQEHASRELRWSSEQAERDRGRDLAQREQASRRDHERQERVAQEAAEDAKQRRITELYTRAVDQIGAGKAPIRLGGLYALERLAQSEIDQRPTIVNVLCAYLRMPYEEPRPDIYLPEHPDLPMPDSLVEQMQEEQVRLAAQKILTEHLQPAKEPEYWGPVWIDLSNANLYKMFFGETCVGLANFTGASFTGDFLWFGGATFMHNAGFSHATFYSTPNFQKATFEGDASFDGANFRSGAVFWEARFNGGVRFHDARGVDKVDLTGSMVSASRARLTALPPGWVLGEDATQDGMVPIVKASN